MVRRVSRVGEILPSPAVHGPEMPWMRCVWLVKRTERTRLLASSGSSGLSKSRGVEGGRIVQRFAAVVMRHRVLVALLWVVITVVGALIAPHLSSRLQSGTTLNTASYTANATLLREYGGVAANPSVLVIDLPAGTTADSPATKPALTAARQVAVRVPRVHDLPYASPGDPALVSNGGQSTLMLVYP